VSNRRPVSNRHRTEGHAARAEKDNSQRRTGASEATPKAAPEPDCCTVPETLPCGTLVAPGCISCWGATHRPSEGDKRTCKGLLRRRSLGAWRPSPRAPADGVLRLLLVVRCLRSQEASQARGQAWSGSGGGWHVGQAYRSQALLCAHPGLSKAHPAAKGKCVAEPRQCFLPHNGPRRAVAAPSSRITCSIRCFLVLAAGRPFRLSPAASLSISLSLPTCLSLPICLSPGPSVRSFTRSFAGASSMASAPMIPRRTLPCSRAGLMRTVSPSAKLQAGIVTRSVLRARTCSL